MSDMVLQPEVMVFAGPNGSGKMNLFEFSRREKLLSSTGKMKIGAGNE